ncbi:MAG: threonine--tRNA ligase [Terriglobia bacterium]
MGEAGTKPVITVVLADGNELELESGSTLTDLAGKIGSRLKKAAVAGMIDGELSDLNTVLSDKARVELVTLTAPEGREVFRHSASHVLAQAVTELFPGVKLGIGPATEDGFYYDFDMDHALTDDDLAKIEKQMKRIVQNNPVFARDEMRREDAIDMFRAAGQPYKVELLEELDDPTVTVYRQGGFSDLCRGPHLPSASKIGALKLLKLAGAYWRGDETNKMLQRVYGAAFASSKELEEFLYRLKEAEKRDHRRLGKELDLFTIDEEVGPGLPLWHPKGALIRKEIEDFWKDEHLKHGYELVMIPHIAKINLWQTSGHIDYYREYMYSPIEIDDQEYILKPMNCPGHIRIFKSRTRSYRELPIRWAELGTVYRYERSGVLHGLLRVRGFTQDDAHVFCRPDQLEEEIIKVIQLVLFMLKTFGFDDYEVYISTRPDEYAGTLENWDKATGALEKALKTVNLAYEIDPGEGVFYGPKIDIKIKDALGRAWQCTTVQVDFNLPERFDVKYVGDDNREHQPIMIHRALLGSMERFVGCLIEHYGGAFPVWLSPIQAVILPIADRHLDYGREVRGRLRDEGVRVELDERSESIGKKIRDAQLQKVPYMIVVGDNEVDEGTLAVRSRDGSDERGVEIGTFVNALTEQIERKSVK